MPNNVGEIRRRKGITMRDLAEKMGAHFTTIAKIERSQRGLTLEWIERFAKALDVAPHELIGGAPPPPQVRMVPMVGKIAAGGYEEALNVPQGEVPVMGGGPRAFALEPSGTSMNRIFQPGAYVVVDPDEPALMDGRIYAIQNAEGAATVKRFRADPPRLEPDSDDPSHQPMLLGAEPIQVIGRVIWQGMAV